MTHEFEGKVVIVTGGAGALGGCAAAHFAQLGATTVLVGRNAANLEAKLQELNTPINMSYEEADVTDKSQVVALREKLLKTHGRIDILLNAAGGNMPGATIGPDQSPFEMSIDDFRKVTDLNLTGSVIPSLVFGEAMTQSGGAIVNYSSMAVERAITRVAGYGASKAGIDNFTRWMSVEMAKKFGEKVRVNAIAPGFFLGKQNLRLLTNEDGSLTARGEDIIRNTPFGRFGDPEELNGALEFLCSDASKFVTGITLPVDGGFSAFSGV